MSTDAHVVLPTTEFDADLRALVDDLGFRIDAIFPADSPTTAIVSGHGVRLRLEDADLNAPFTLHLLSDQPGDARVLPGGAIVEHRPRTTTYTLPDNRPALVISRNDQRSEVGRAGMRYRDLLPDRWGGRFIASHITIPVGGPVPDYVHFHKVRFQMIVVKAGWVELVYEDQGQPFVMRAGDCVLQPPEIRHRVLTSSPGLEVIEIGCPAEHETIADHSMELPTGNARLDRDFRGQHFVRHVAADAAYVPWRLHGYVSRDTGIGLATAGLAGVRVARPDAAPNGQWISHDTEFCAFVVLAGAVAFETPDGDLHPLAHGDAVFIPADLRYRLVAPSDDLELLDVTLPAQFDSVLTS